MNIFDDIITEQNNAIESVKNAINNAYFKQLNMLENYDGNDLLKFPIFQEGFIFPRTPRELDIFKFDNKHIIKAIRYFNKARSSLPSVERFFDVNEKKSVDSLRTTYGDLLNEVVKKPNGPFQLGIMELEKQFDCELQLQYSDFYGPMATNHCFPLSQKNVLTISKHKGFQLNGLKVDIDCDIYQIMCNSASYPTLFGQSVVSIFLHEIFHNIVHMTNVLNTNVLNHIESSLNITSDIKNAKSAKNAMSGLMANIKRIFKLENNDVDIDKTINRLCVLASVQNDDNALNKLKQDIDKDMDKTQDEKDLDKYIDELKNIKKYETKKIRNKKMSKIISIACTIILSGLYVYKNHDNKVIRNAAIISGSLLSLILSISMILKNSAILNVGLHEEYYCDLFAGMYQLPIHITSFHRLVKLNKKYTDKVSTAIHLEKDISKIIKDEHPVDFDREQTSYIIAKQILTSKKHIKPEIKKYLKYIVNLHEGIEDMHIDTKDSLKKIDPEKAKDIQQFMKDFVSQSGITVTESFIPICYFKGYDYYD